jgi:hypothetical protein
LTDEKEQKRPNAGEAIQVGTGERIEAKIEGSDLGTEATQLGFDGKREKRVASTIGVI